MSSPLTGTLEERRRCDHHGGMKTNDLQLKIEVFVRAPISASSAPTMG